MSNRAIVVLAFLVCLGSGWNCAAQTRTVQPGRVFVWGGPADATVRVVPPGLEAVQVSAGGYHALARRADGTVVAWGSNEYGQCNVPPGLVAIDIAAGRFHSLAIRPDGSVVAWGGYPSPISAPASIDAKMVETEMEASIAIKQDASVATWVHGVTPGPLQMPDGLKAKIVGAGQWHYLAVRPDGTVAAWGNNNKGQCDVPPGLVAKRIAAARLGSAAITLDGSVVAWGWMASAPLGNDFVELDGGNNHFIFLKSDGSIVQTGWGGALNNKPSWLRASQVSAGTSFVMAIEGVPVIDCPTDYNGDDEADVLDFLDFLDDYGQCDGIPAPCGSIGDSDFNGDTLVDVLDFLDFIDAFARGC